MNPLARKKILFGCHVPLTKENKMEKNKLCPI
jgi:hypothetical protein